MKCDHCDTPDVPLWRYAKQMLCRDCWRVRAGAERAAPCARCASLKQRCLKHPDSRTVPISDESMLADLQASMRRLVE